MRLTNRIFAHLCRHLTVHVVWLFIAGIIWWNPLTWWLPSTGGPRSHGTTAGSSWPAPKPKAPDYANGGTGIEEG